MDANQLYVWMDSDLAATIRRNTAGNIVLNYDDDYRTSAGPTPLSVSLPAEEASHSGPHVESFLENLLPDNPAVVERWRRRYQTRDLIELIARVGDDVAGKPRFTESIDLPNESVSPSTPVSDAEIGARIQALLDDETQWHGGEPERWSLAGFQRKITLRKLPDGTWATTDTNNPSTHILKPAIPSFENHDLNEHLCLATARQAGIPSAKTSVEDFNGVTAIAVQRYDRTATGRVHQEDLCQALGVPPHKKYQVDGGPTVADIAKLLRDVSAQPQADVERFADALILNWLLRAPDAHAKNYSLILSGGSAVLAPLYDVGSDAPYDRSKQQSRLAHKIGKEARPEWIKERHWVAASEQLGVDIDHLLGRISQLSKDIPDALSDQVRLVATEHPQLATAAQHIQSKIAEHVRRIDTSVGDTFSMHIPPATPLPTPAASGAPFNSQPRRGENADNGLPK